MPQRYGGISDSNKRKIHLFEKRYKNLLKMLLAEFKNEIALFYLLKFHATSLPVAREHFGAKASSI